LVIIRLCPNIGVILGEGTVSIFLELIGTAKVFTWLFAGYKDVSPRFLLLHKTVSERVTGKLLVDHHFILESLGISARKSRIDEVEIL
jgi:hypothetical protein